MQPQPNTEAIVSQLTTGSITALSRAITLIESSRPEHQAQANELINRVLPMTGRSVRIGITGVPGVGKSTFIESFGMHLIEQGKKVAVLAIDPSSSKSKGSILGDKTRMEKLSAHPDSFIRPTAASGSLGGVAYKTREATLLCEAAGFDVIIIETVGVGQSETEVAQLCDFFLLLMLTGAGDELQGIKRGIMEMADGIVITKADGANKDKAKLARAEFARALHFFPASGSGWKPEVLAISSYENEGIDSVWNMIDKYERHTKANGYFETKRNAQDLYAFEKTLQNGLLAFLSRKDDIQRKKTELMAQITSKNISPYAAAIEILKMISS